MNEITFAFGAVLFVGFIRYQLQSTLYEVL